MDEVKPISKIEFDHYKGKYFVGMVENGKGQFLHYNKKGWELQNGLSKKAVIFKYKNADDNKRFETIANSPFKFCYKIDCLEYLYNIKKQESLFKRIVIFLREVWS